MTNVTPMGGNQYMVTIDDQTRTVDLDGVTIVSDSDFSKIERAGLSTEGFLTPSDYNVTGEADLFWLEAAKTALNYSGFDVKSYLSEFDVESYIADYQ